MLFYQPCPKCGYVETPADGAVLVCQQCHEIIDVDNGYVFKDETDQTLYVICPHCEGTMATFSAALTWRECPGCGEVFADFGQDTSQDWLDGD